MTRPPVMLTIRVVKGGREKVALRLPVILFLLVLLPVVVLLAPVVFAAALGLVCVGKRGPAMAILLAAPLLLYIFFALEGLKIHTVSGGNSTFVAFE